MDPLGLARAASGRPGVSKTMLPATKSSKNEALGHRTDGQVAVRERERERDIYRERERDIDIDIDIDI